ncbi:NUDIX domain-containing protein [Candidatus Mycosynbacter amalyticus]|uniref:NUDIX domain-containing protein n=1 Tax=Candidatus Mycosynbacter amalyticus TaxID=2665156 RepID=A0A857ML05_9BACT|nr:NUDIX domain-containing protein [Candidatus Mycosynbacter amalyticus]QHN43246.1 NUDIX domain-containing protein [Candidatus Mycosynbacter amalyticus]
MGHIHDKPGQIDQTVSAYVLRRDGDEVYIMLHNHKKLHKLLPVGGHVELDETPWSAMAHELTEESGYSVEELKILQPVVRIEKLDKVALHPQPFVVQTHNVVPGHYHTDMGYIFIAETHPRGRVADGESEDIRWFTRDGIVRIAEDDIWRDTRQMCLEIFDKFLANWQPLPATDFDCTWPRSS